MLTSENPDPRGHLLLVLADPRPDLLAELSALLPGMKVTQLRVRVRARLSRASWVLRPGKDSPVVLSEPIRRVLARDRSITHILCDGKGVARLVWYVAHHRRDVVAFTHVDHLVRALRGKLPIDLSATGHRRADLRFTYESVRSAAPLNPGAGATRLLVGPRNEHGAAHYFAAAVQRESGPETLSLSVGNDGYPADIMVSDRDWETPAVRRHVLSDCVGASHVLLDGPIGPVAEQLRHALPGARIAVIDDSPTPEGNAAERTFTTRPDLAASGRAWLAWCLPAGLVSESNATTTEGSAIVIDDGDDAGTNRTGSGEVGAIRLLDLDPVIRLAAASRARLILDVRRSPLIDLPVLAAMAAGAILVADLPDTSGWLCGPVPHLNTRRQAHSLSVSERAQLQEASRAFALRNHDGRLTSLQLAAFLDGST